MNLQIKKGIIFLLPYIICTASLTAQDKYFTKSGSIQFFYQKATIETIDRQLTAVLPVCWIQKPVHIQFAVLMKGFEFRKALMQEHFNENYVESDKYPKAEVSRANRKQQRK